MSPKTYRCLCGATLEYRQDLEKESGGHTPTWLCTDCRTPVPGIVAEQLRHQHPS